LHTHAHCDKLTTGGKTMPTTNKRVNIALSKETLDKLEQIAKETGQPISAVVRNMVHMQIDTMKMAVEIMKDNDNMLQIIRMMKEGQANEQ
jgi:predicted DNA-binding protein